METPRPLGNPPEAPEAPEPVVRQSNLQVVRIPADGSRPHRVRMNTIENNDNVDRSLFHIPDFRPFWGNGEGFRRRDMARVDVTNQSLLELNGIYFGWKSLAMDHFPRSEHTGFYGDAFIARASVWEYGGNGALYKDVPAVFLETPLFWVTLKILHDY